MSEEMVRVRIRGRQEVNYDQEVEMTREEYDELKEQVEEHDGCFTLFSDPVSDWLDLTDVDADDGLQDVELELLDEED